MVESVALHQRTECQNGLSTWMAPAHARTFQALGDKGLACGLDDARADRETTCLHRGVAHPVTMLAEVGELGRDLGAARMLVAKIHEGSDDVLHPVFTLEEDVTVLLELAYAPSACALRMRHRTRS